MRTKVDLKLVCEETFGIPSSRYHRMVRRGLVPRAIKGKIDFLKAAKGIIDYYRKLSKGDGEVSLADIGSVNLTAGQACTFFEVTRHTLRNWVGKGFPQSGRGIYPLVQGFRWYKKNILGDVGEKTSLAEEKLRRERARREREEILLSQLKGELVRRGEATSWILGLVSEIRINFISLPKRLSPSLEAKNVKEIELVLREEINSILNRISGEVRSEKKKRSQDSKRDSGRS